MTRKRTLTSSKTNPYNCTGPSLKHLQTIVRENEDDKPKERRSKKPKQPRMKPKEEEDEDEDDEDDRDWEQVKSSHSTV